MMIRPEYCGMMARYNAWQNQQLMDVMSGLSDAEVTRDHKAFFGSILGTVNHVMWGDLAWMSRLDGGPAPEGGLGDTTELTASVAAWTVERVRVDGRIKAWADQLKDADLRGDLSWYSGTFDRDVVKPVAMCAVHMFNHQTHHRGQVHAMLTASGARGPVSDLVFMPE